MTTESYFLGREQLDTDIVESEFSVLSLPHRSESLVFTDKVLNTCSFNLDTDPGSVAAVLQWLASLSQTPMLSSVMVLSYVDDIRQGSAAEEFFKSQPVDVFVENGRAMIRCVRGATLQDLKQSLARAWSYAFLNSLFNAHLVHLFARTVPTVESATIPEFAHLLVTEQLADMLSRSLVSASFDYPTDNAQPETIAKTALLLHLISRSLAKSELSADSFSFIEHSRGDAARTFLLNALKQSAFETGNQNSLRLLAYLGNIEIWRSLSGQLKSLDLSGEFLTWEDLAFLAVLNNLEYLNLSRTSIGAANKIPITNLRSLRVLDLSITRITNSIIVLISNLRGLHELNIRATSVTDTSIEYLRNLFSLARLNIADTALSDQSRETLMKELPDCALIS